MMKVNKKLLPVPQDGEAAENDKDPMEGLNDKVRPVSLIGLVIFIAFFVGLVGWAALAPLASAAFANGNVEIEGNRKTVQHKEGGVVKSLLVREGSEVQAGDPLIVLDDTQASSVHDLLREQYYAMLAQIARLEAEQADTGTVTFPKELMAEAAQRDDVRRIVDSQEQAFAARRTLLQNQVSTLEQRRKQLDEQIGGLEAQITSHKRQMQLLRDELKGTKELQQKGHAPMTRVRALERSLAALEGQVGEYRGKIAQIQESDAEIQMQIISLKRNRISEAAEKLAELRSQAFTLNERIVAAKDILDRSIIRAPASGRVLGLEIHTEGGVIAPGQPLMDIVPGQRNLVVKAALEPNAIDNVHVGMDAEVQFAAFDSRFTERIIGEIVDISADAKENKKVGALYYELRVVVPPDELAKLGKDVELAPGMPVTVKIVTGDRTALSYFTKPITRTFDKAFTEQ